MQTLKVVFMGTPEFSVRPLKYLIADGYKVVAAYTQPDKSAGRGRLLSPSPVKRYAGTLQLPVLQPRNFRSSATIAELAAFAPDVMIVAAFGQILPKAVLDIPRYGCINVHPSLLPRFRGVSPVPAAILAGDEFTGVSIMLLDPGMDTGPILTRVQLPVLPWDTTGSLTERLARIGGELLVDILPYWIRGEMEPRPQDDSKATYCGMIHKEDGLIDWHLTAVDISRRVRAFSPWPGAFTLWQGKQLKILEASPAAANSGLHPGGVVDPVGGGAAFGVGTGDGVLSVWTVQMEGKRTMPAVEFLRGQRQFLGAILTG
jgi:methionyl-tRNA formyltransferase